MTLFRLIIAVPLLILSACSSNPTVHGPDYSVLESEDRVAQRAIRQYVVAAGAPANSQFRYVLEDMNNDGRNDVVAMFTLPYHYWCGAAGCTMMVFRGVDGGFTPVTEITSVYGPVVLTDTVTSGWRDIAVRSSGTNLRDRDVALQFNGRSYPNNPLHEPSLPQPIYSTQGRRVFP